MIKIYLEKDSKNSHWLFLIPKLLVADGFRAELARRFAVSYLPK